MKKFTILLVCLVTLSAAFSQKSWVSFKGTQQPEQAALSIIESNQQGMIIEVNVPGMYLQELTHGDMAFQHISLTDGKTTKAVGRPELPMINEVIGIPGNLKVSCNIIDMETTTLNGYHIYPFQTPTTDNPGGHDKEFVMDEAFYAKDASYPSENVVMGQPQIWRDVKLTNLHITPFSYNPARQELTAITKLVVEVEFSGVDQSMSFNPDKELTPKFYNMYEKAIPNFEDLGYALTYREEPGIKYLIIANEEAVDALQPLVDWKNQMGHTVEVKTLGTGFETPQDFKTYITDLYNSDGLEYVLMVGDAYPNGGSGGGPNIVPMYYWAPSGEDASYSDSWYTCLDGSDDHYADLAIGRFVYDSNSLDELELQISKTMSHYLAPDVSGNWAENTILVAHKENYPAKYTECCEEIAEFSYTIQTPVFEKAYGGEGYTNAQVVEFVNETGVGIFNYRGHGSQTQMWDWTNSGTSHFTAAEVAQLNNTDRLFVFFDVCCDNMDIVGYNGECLCESFMKHETGSVAVNGAIIPSYTIPNHDYDKEMYKAVFEEGISTIGYISNFANITVLNDHGTIGRSNVRTYLWLGDASIEPWTMQPTELTVSHDEQLFLGVSEFNVSVLGQSGPAEGAMVCVSNEDGSIYAVAYADESGVAMVTFDESVQIPGDVTVTVTSHNYLPYQAVLPVIPQDGPYVVKESYELNDADGGNGNGLMDYAESILMSISVKNVGIQTAENVVVTISTEDEYITITDGEESYGDVDPEEVVLLADGFAFDVAEDLPDGHAVIFEVSASDGTNNWESTIIITGHAPVLEMGDYMISDPGGNNNGKLDPGETATLTVYLDNTGSAEAYDVMGVVEANNPYLTVITTDPQEYGDVDPDGQAMASFEVSADMETPAGYFAALMFEATGMYDIEAMGEFSVVIGQIPVVIIDLDGNTSSGTVMLDAMNTMDISAEYMTSIPEELTIYSSAFVFLGVYSSNHTLTTSEGQQLADFLNAGGMLYMEGGDTWYYDDPTAVHDMFHINAVSDGSGDLGTINGMSGTFTEGMSFSYSGENNWIDQIEPGVGAVMILENQNPNYGTAVAYDAGTYKTIGASHEFGGLGTSEATQEELITKYLSYFEVISTSVTASFAATVTEVCEGEEVSYTDFSTGGVTEWYWEFEGGYPATSTEQNPTVMYMAGGDWDVSLTVTGENGSNTMVEEDYITTMFMPETAGDISGNEETCQGYEEVFSVDDISWAETYNWVLEPEEAGDMTMDENVATILISSDYEGTATLKVCGGNQCGEGGWSSEFSIVVNTCVGIDEMNNAVLAVYPNPSTGQFTLDLTANDVVNVRIMNAIGEVVYEMNDLTVNGRTSTNIDLNGLAEGVYYLKLDGNNTNVFEKIVIAR